MHAALGVNSDYIEYMMGHKISTYHDVKMKGVEFLCNIYAASGLSMRMHARPSRRSFEPGIWILRRSSPRRL